MEFDSYNFAFSFKKRFLFDKIISVPKDTLDEIDSSETEHYSKCWVSYYFQQTLNFQLTTKDVLYRESLEMQFNAIGSTFRKFNPDWKQI